MAALDGLDLTVEEGHVVGLLGPNGAGKTTALRILVGLVKADAGVVTIDGETVDRSWVAGERVGAMVSSPVFYPSLSGIGQPARPDRRLGMAAGPCGDQDRRKRCASST